MIRYINRRDSDCYKWDSECAKDNLPLWVADMDFEAAPAILRALKKRVDHGVFGYQHVPDCYFEAVRSWFERRHHWTGITPENTIPTIGVVPAVAAVLRAMTRPGDKVLMHTPAYNCFFRCLDNAGCRLVESPLICRNAHYEIDWKDMEQKLPGCKALLLCNPHNPTGRIWTRDELSRLAEMCRREHVFVIADEIHCEFAFPGQEYTPFATIAQDDYFCVCTSPSKAFNIAGLQCGNIYCTNEQAQAAIRQAVDANEVGNINCLAVYSLMAAYNESEQWITELMQLVYGNWCFIREFIRENNLPLSLTEMEGTYLAWVALPEGTLSAGFCEALAKEQHVLFNPSDMYGTEGFIRINMATSREMLAEAMQRMKNYLANH